jgi:hypothetical protein
VNRCYLLHYPLIRVVDELGISWKDFIASFHPLIHPTMQCSLMCWFVIHFFLRKCKYCPISMKYKCIFINWTQDSKYSDDFRKFTIIWVYVLDKTAKIVISCLVFCEYEQVFDNKCLHACIRCKTQVLP